MSSIKVQPSRFALLKVEGDEDEDGEQRNNAANKQNQQKSQKKKNKKKKQQQAENQEVIFLRRRHNFVEPNKTYVCVMICDEQFLLTSLAVPEFYWSIILLIYLSLYLILTFY